MRVKFRETLSCYIYYLHYHHYYHGVSRTRGSLWPQPGCGGDPLVPHGRPQVRPALTQPRPLDGVHSWSGLDVDLQALHIRPLSSPMPHGLYSWSPSSQVHGTINVTCVPHNNFSRAGHFTGAALGCSGAGPT